MADLTDIGFELIVAYHRETGVFERAEAARALRDRAKSCAARGVPVQLDPEFARLIARELAGELQRRQGRRVPLYRMSGLSWIGVLEMRREYRRRRARGEKFDATVASLAERFRVSASSVKAHLRSVKDDNS